MTVTDKIEFTASPPPSLPPREQSKVGLQEPERNKEVLISSKTCTVTKAGSSNFGKQEPEPKLKTKPLTSDRKSKIQQGTSWFSKSFVKCEI